MTGDCWLVAYPSRRQVHAAQRGNGKRMRAFLCPNCHFWHATTAQKDLPRLKFSTKGARGAGTPGRATHQEATR